MSVAFIIVSVVGTIVLLLFLVALVLPKHYSVTVSETINKPKKTVYDYVSLLKNQTQYSEWLKADPNLRQTIVGTDGMVGAILQLESHNEDKNKNVGLGEQEIKGMDENQIVIELRLIKPMPATCKLINKFVEMGIDQTYYTCVFCAYAKFPINLPSYLFGRNFIIKAQRKTLRNIKALIEQGG